MTRVLVLTLFACCLTLPALAQSQAELDAARVPLEAYLKGHATGDGTHMREAFHPDARIFWMRNGQVASRTAAEFAGLFNRGPAPDEADRKRSITHLEVTGDVGIATIELDYPNAFLTDYMTLIKVDGAWKIINKSYTRAAPRDR
ncbi:MAG: nuclear transport factor 2 family protein [Bacteroidota bacterium]